MLSAQTDVEMVTMVTAFAALFRSPSLHQAPAASQDADALKVGGSRFQTARRKDEAIG